MLLVDRVMTHRHGQLPRARAGPLILLTYIGVLTHPALDWLNTYGVRLLMPFDGHWFYGDALFIIDPWVWLLAGAAVVLAHTQTASATSAWLALGLVLSVIVSGFGLVPPLARLLWIAGVATIAGLRAWGGVQTRLPRVATIGLACATVYMVAMVWGSRVAEGQVTEWLAERGTVPVETMAGPVPANPFARAIVVVDRQHYHFLEVNWLNAGSDSGQQSRHRPWPCRSRRRSGAGDSPHSGDHDLDPFPGLHRRGAPGRVSRDDSRRPVCAARWGRPW